MSGKADVIIVGGGVMGLSIALHLRQLGVGRVLLIEKRFCGAGSSGKSGAICRQHYSNEITAALARDSLRWYASECAAHFHRSGCLFFTDPAQAATMALNVELLRSIGINTEMCDTATAAEIDPRLGLDDAPAVCVEPDAGWCDALGIVDTLQERAATVGVELLCGARAERVVVSGGRAAGVELESGTRVTADVIVNAANAWAGPLAATADINLPIRVTKPQIAFSLRPRDGHAASPAHPIIADLIHGFYARADLPGQTLIGGLDIEADPEVPDPDREPEGIADDMVEDLNQRIARRIPEMSRSRSRGGMGALYACTPDHHAIIGTHSECAGLVTCAGFSGHGFKLAPEIGREVAHHIVKGGYDRHDLEIYRPSRFAEGQPVRGRYEYSLLG